MSLRPLSIVLLSLALFLPACGGGGGQDQDDDEDVDPLAILEGDWRGSCLLAGGVIDMTVGPAGEVTQILSDGVSENATGSFAHVAGRLYAVAFLFAGGQPTEWRLLLDATGTYAALSEVDGPQMVALQRDATTILPRALSDYSPGQYTGQAARLDAAATLLQLGACSMSIGAPAQYSGTFGALSFFLPPGSPLDLRVANGTVLSGSYDDNAADTDGDQFFVVSCPDGGAVAIVAFDTAAGRPVFFGLLRTL